MLGSSLINTKINHQPHRLRVSHRKQKTIWPSAIIAYEGIVVESAVRVLICFILVESRLPLRENFISKIR